jgi:ribosomal protein S18 acetylase RimI-like enzyme
MNIIKSLTPKDINSVLDLAYKAVYERGWVGVDFDKASFNFRVKNILISAQNKCFGMFREQKLIGFVVAQIDTVPWNTELRCHIDLIHLDTAHRDPVYYQLLFDTVIGYCNDNNIKNIRTSSRCYLMDSLDKEEFLMNNGFLQTDTTWEKHSDS